MFAIRRVLFGVDFAAGCQALVPTVRRMIEYWHAEVTLLHVIEEKRWPGRKHDLERLMLRMRAIARQLGERDVRCRLERGNAAERLLEYARANQIHLVVVSGRGASGRSSSMIGPVADQLLTEAACCVWLDWGPAHSNRARGMHARRVACALAHNDSDEYVLHEADDISGNLDAELTVIQAVCAGPGKPLVLFRDRPVRDAAIAIAKQRIEILRRRFFAPAEVAVETGSHAAVVRRVIQRQAAGLLITGNLREAIVAAAPHCPVLRVATPAAVAARAALELPYAAVAGRSA
ncbi:MAG TPA: universal stress protein [Bryobacteraceae bacterium]|nr:universal stress protein [Bryobacteraceae bacterium]